jgi:hypothetical protein
MLVSNKFKYQSLIGNRFKSFFLDLFAFAILFDLSDKINYYNLEATLFFTVHLVLFTLSLILDSHKLIFQVLFFTLYSLSGLIQFPIHSNHGVLTLFMAIYILIDHFFRSDRKFFDTLNTLKIILIIVYFFTGVHKLNYDFLHPEYSCSTYFINQLIYAFTRSETLSFPSLVYVISPFGILFLELIESLGLGWSKTIKFARIGYLFFHGLLALIGFVDFSSLALVLLVFFSPVKQILFLQSIMKGKKTRIFLLSWVASFAFISYFLYTLAVIPLSLLKLIQGLLFLTPLVYFYFRIKDFIPAAKSIGIRRPRGIFSLSFIIFICFYSSQNYIGLSSATTFSMFSNLVTETPQNNHLLFSKSLQLFDLQRDHVFINSSEFKKSLETYCSQFNPIDRNIIPKHEFDRCILRLSQQVDTKSFPASFTIINTETMEKTHLQSQDLFHSEYFKKINHLMIKLFRVHIPYRGRQYCTW